LTEVRGKNLEVGITSLKKNQKKREKNLVRSTGRCFKGKKKWNSRSSEVIWGEPGKPDTKRGAET